MYYLVAYAKFTQEKETGVQLQGVYFADIADNEAAAHQIAKHCVNTIKGGTILAKIAKVENQLHLLEALYDITDQFEKLLLQMQETEKIISKNNQR